METHSQSERGGYLFISSGFSRLSGKQLMGPRSRERGVAIPTWSAYSQGMASMGPRSRERGVDPMHKAMWETLLRLQWGRAHVSAE